MIKGLLVKVFKFSIGKIFEKRPNVVEAVCYTDLEQYKNETWPSKFPVLPGIGNRVVSRTGKTLIVCSVEFTDMNERGFSHAKVDSIAKIRLKLGVDFSV